MNISRIIRSFSAHSYGQIITVGSTLLIPSVLVAKWGATGFGFWISLSALSQFFQMADWSISLALSNQLCLLNDRPRQDAWNLISCTVNRYLKKLGLTFVAIILSIPLVVIWHHSVDSQNDFFLLGFGFLFLSLTAALQPAQSIYMAAWRYNGLNEIGIFIHNTTRLVDVALVLLIAATGGELIHVAISLFIAKITYVSLFYWHLPRLVLKNKSRLTNLHVTTAHCEMASINRAGGGFSLIAMSQLLTLHGPVILISMVLGPVQAAIFAACRTVSRLPVQPLMVFLASINPELTVLIAEGRYKEMRTLALKMVGLVVVGGLLTVFIPLVYIQEIQQLWLHGKLELNFGVLLPLSIASVFFMAGQVFNQCLSSANLTAGQGREIFATSVFMLIGIAAVLYFTNQSKLIAYVILFADGFVLLVLSRRLNKLPLQKTA